MSLSAGNLAGQVTGYRDEGAGVDQVLAVLQSAGQTPRSLVAQNDYRGQDWPQGWQAKRSSSASPPPGTAGTTRFRRHRVLPDLRLARGIGTPRLRRRARRRGHHGLPRPAAYGD